jgi:glycosyltransferase involved in cell wall biosynthesis
MSPVKIAMLAPVAWRTPPRHYGPWERVAGLLTEGLVAQGHDVTLFATADSLTSASLESIAPQGYEEDRTLDGRVWEAMHVAHAIDRSAEFDIVHSHLDWLPLALVHAWRAPLVTTIHGFSGPRILPVYEAARSNYVSISDADRSPLLDYVATVRHGIDLDELQFSASATEDLAVFGRIHPDKGTADAIEIARRLGRRLIICGIVQDEVYFAAHVAPHIDGDQVVYLGSVGSQERSRVLGSAAVLLHPIHFDEPFGLSVVEAMATGTPVVAYRRGSMEDVIDDGVTGFSVNDLDAAVDAVERASDLNRVTVRATASRRFSVERMVDEYLAVYERILR